MRKHIDSAYKILSKVYQDGTYSNMAFLGERVSDMSTRLVYGTLEENVKIDYILFQQKFDVAFRCHTAVYSDMFERSRFCG